VAGSDNNSGALDTTYSEKSFFVNLIGNMTAITSPSLKDGFRCQTDAGTATVQINKNGAGAGSLSGTLACTTAMGANTPGAWSSTAIALDDVLDFSITATSGAKRVTVCIGTTVP
jgi:hypothetical protein